MADGFRGIPGVPEGWELVRIGSPVYGEFYLDNQGNIQRCEYDKLMSTNYPIIRKIEKLKRYRPFANGEEFKPHRGRWIRFADGSVSSCWKINWYKDEGVFLGHGQERVFLTFEHRLGEWVFDDDGSPFGVEVTDE